jgi:hypothetical protein
LTGTIVAGSAQILENPTLRRVIGHRAQGVRQHLVEGAGEFNLRRDSSCREGCGTNPGEVLNRAEFGTEGFPKEEETTARVKSDIALRARSGEGPSESDYAGLGQLRHAISKAYKCERIITRRRVEVQLPDPS